VRLECVHCPCYNTCVSCSVFVGHIAGHIFKIHLQQEDVASMMDNSNTNSSSSSSNSNSNRNVTAHHEVIEIEEDTECTILPPLGKRRRMRK
jgi:hypothetical protein